MGSEETMGASKREMTGPKCRDCAVVGVGVGRNSRPGPKQGEPVLTVLVRDHNSAEEPLECCAPIAGMLKSDLIEILEVGRVVALPRK